MLDIFSRLRQRQSCQCVASIVKRMDKNKRGFLSSLSTTAAPTATAMATTAMAPTTATASTPTATAAVAPTTATAATPTVTAGLAPTTATTATPTATAAMAPTTATAAAAKSQQEAIAISQPIIRHQSIAARE